MNPKSKIYENSPAISKNGINTRDIKANLHSYTKQIINPVKNRDMFTKSLLTWLKLS